MKNFLQKTFKSLPALALLGSGSLWAETIDIANSSFETNGGGDLALGGWNNDISTEWQERDGDNAGGSLFEYIDGFAAEGTDHLGVAELGYYVWQDTGVPFSPNTTYELTVAVGNRNANFTQDGNSSVYAILNSAENLGLNGNLFTTGEVLNDPAHVASASWDAFVNVPEGTFLDAPSLIFTTGDTAPTGTIVVLLGDNSFSGRSHIDNIRLRTIILGDVDGDGLPAQWELENNLDDNDANGDNGANGDPDNDGRTNLQEFESNTNPNDSDSDSDGLSDGEEQALGTDPLDADSDSDGLNDGAEQTAGTNPLDADSDDDGLFDGVETNTGTFIGTTDTGTDPLNEDTDNDGRTDGTEVANGSNPVEFDNFTSGLLLIKDHSFEENAGADLAAGGWSNDLTPEWQEAGGDNNGSSFEEFITDFAADGTDHIGMATGYYIYQDTGIEFEPNTTYQLTVATGNRNGQSTAGNQSVYAILNSTDGLGPAGAFTTADVLLDPALLASESYDAFANVPSGTFEDAPPLLFTTTDAVPAGTIVVLVGDNSGGGRSHFDNLRLQTVTLGDIDGDGLPLQWELDNGLNDNDGSGANGASGDPDNDGRTNLEEFESKTDPQDPDTDDDGSDDGNEEVMGTDPRDADSDDDGLLDGVESASGAFVGASDTGTDPLDADSDDDGLLDGVETNTGTFVGVGDTGTNPLDADTDGDGRPDAMEVANGSDPNVAEIFDGQALEVRNFGFETNDLAPGGWNNELGPDWEGVNGTNSGEAFFEYIDGFSAEGTDHVGMATGYFIWQDTGIAVAPNTTYRLTVSVGNRNTNFTQPGNSSTYAVVSGTENLGNTLFTTADVVNDPATLGFASWDASVEVPEASFLSAPSLEFTTGSDVSGTLVIVLGDNSAGGRSHFDNIRLEMVGPSDTTPRVENLAVDSNNGFVDFDAANLVVGRTYHLVVSDDLENFEVLADSEFEASDTVEEISIRVNLATQTRAFVKIVEGPAPGL